MSEREYTEDEPRFWVTDADKELHAEEYELGLVGLVDEEDGGIVAWFPDEESAQVAQKTLNRFGD